MDAKLLSLLFLSSALLANPNPPAEETINLSQTPQYATMSAQNQAPTQPMQQTLSAQGNNAIQQPAPMQPMHNMSYPNNMAGGYGGASLQKVFAKVQQMYPGSFVTDVDYKGFGYEIEINDSLELLFDMGGNLLWQKWD
ncbi:PepSY-like domain-containing protein [Helicobacter rodentium]|uniref:PepSY-like domain-containing protein n=1 Tax=Helicobacter rodentium TaxID=59617 RepID=UPI00068D993C|nr:hypothetical protein [Helicobacter rodentium]